MNATPGTHRTFMHALKQLEDLAWESLFDSYQNRLLSDIRASLRHRNLDQQHAEDVAGDTWLIAITNICDVHCDDMESLYHWLRVISFNHVRNLSRKKQPDMSLQDVQYVPSTQDWMSFDRFLLLHGMVHASPEHEAERLAQLRQVQLALCRLKPRDREFWLRRHLLSEMPSRIAADHNMKPRTVSQALSRTARKLREMVEIQGVQV